jgi:transposase InsO family protein
MSLAHCCCLLGVTRQAYYQNSWDAESTTLEEELVVRQVRSIKKQQPVIGCRKLYVMLQPFLMEHGIKMGRDALFDLLASHRLLVRRRRRRVSTTQSSHWLRRYPNLIRDVVPSRPNEVWVSDITYYRIATGFLYISFVTDAYSKKIVGYHVADTMEAVHTASALRMAIDENGNSLEGLIHHSDRGLQYCSSEYVKLLQDKGILVSMTESGDPLENAVAERVNGIMKEEFLNHCEPLDKHEAAKLLATSVGTYNTQRPHMSCNMLTPSMVHREALPTKRTWKNYYPKKHEPVNQWQD